MNALHNFDFHDKPMRIVLVDDDPWWVAADLCALLGLSNVTNAVRRLDDDQVTLIQIKGASNGKPVNCVCESGMWMLVLRSDKAEAVELRRFLSREVLPALRKHGYYEMPGGDPPPVQASELDPSRLVAGVSVVRLAMRLYGPVAARGLWAQVGLPPVTPDSEVGPGADPFAEPLAVFLTDKVETTIQQAGEGIGLIDIDWSTRYRIGRLLAQWGWRAANRKVAKGRTARVFSRPSTTVTIVQEPAQ